MSAMRETTLGWLSEHERTVRWECEVAPLGHNGQVDLGRLAKAKGGTFSLANRRPACKIPGCPGRVRFVDRSSMWARPLDTITDRDEAYWEYEAAFRKRMASAGWEIQSGYWFSPDRVEHR